MKYHPTLTIITTALNEEKNVFPFLSRLKDMLEENKISHQVLFVDDGSSDNTLIEAKKFNHWSQLSILSLPKNKGSGAAIKEALKIAEGEWYAWLPCDLEIFPEEILKPYAIRHKSNVVVTYFSKGQESRSLKRRLFSFLFTKILNFSFNNQIPYYNGLSLIKRSLINEEKILSNGFFFHAELLIRVLARSPKFSTVAIQLSPRTAEKTKALKLKVFKDVVQCYLQTFWEVKVREARAHH